MTTQGFDNLLGEGLGDRYHPLQPLGKKAGRQTWLVQDLQTQERVVLKLLTFSNDFSWDDLKLFEREAETLRTLNHPAIPRYLDHFEVNSAQHKGFALVQTYIDARSLEQQLKAGRTFTEPEVKQLAKDLLEILTYLHDRQPPVIHRDIKPSNILLSNRSGNHPGQVYLVDFGSVQTLAAREGGTVTVVGTYGYMPPEQFGGRAVPASDLYSLGATLIYLVTGQHPADLPQTDLRLEFEHAAALSPVLTSWLKWMTEPSLSQRPKSAQEALEGLQSGRSGQSKAIPLARQPIPQPHNSRITMVRQGRAIEFTLPYQGVSFRTTSGCAWLMAFLFFPFLAMFLLLGGVFWVVTRLFGQTKVRLDLDSIVIIRELFHWKVSQPLKAPTRHIWKLSSSPWTGRLVLWTGTQKCEFRGTTAELQWLAYELSEWLDLPITEEYF